MGQDMPHGDNARKVKDSFSGVGIELTQLPKRLSDDLKIAHDCVVRAEITNEGSRVEVAHVLGDAIAGHHGVVQQQRAFTRHRRTDEFSPLRQVSTDS